MWEPNESVDEKAARVEYERLAKLVMTSRPNISRELSLNYQLAMWTYKMEKWERQCGESILQPGYSEFMKTPEQILAGYEATRQGFIKRIEILKAELEKIR